MPINNEITRNAYEFFNRLSPMLSPLYRQEAALIPFTRLLVLAWTLESHALHTRRHYLSTECHPSWSVLDSRLESGRKLAQSILYALRYAEVPDALTLKQHASQLVTGDLTQELLDTADGMLEFDLLSRYPYQHLSDSPYGSYLVRMLWSALRRAGDRTPLHPAPILPFLLQFLPERYRSVPSSAAYGIFGLPQTSGPDKLLLPLWTAVQHACAYGLRRLIWVTDGPDSAQQLNEDFSLALIYSVNTLRVREYATAPGREWDTYVVVLTSEQFFGMLTGDEAHHIHHTYELAGSAVVIDLPLHSVTDLSSQQWGALNFLADRSSSAVFLTQWSRERVLGVSVTEVTLTPERAALLPPAAVPGTAYRNWENWNELAAELKGVRQGLVIVPSLADAAELFAALGPGHGHFYYSEAQCAEHRINVLTRIRERQRKGQPCHVVATPLIERALITVDRVFRLDGAGESSLGPVIQGRLASSAPAQPSPLPDVPEVVHPGEDRQPVLITSLPGHIRRHLSDLCRADPIRSAEAWQTLQSYLVYLTPRQREENREFIAPVNWPAYDYPTWSADEMPFQEQWIGEYDKVMGLGRLLR